MLQFIQSFIIGLLLVIVILILLSIFLEKKSLKSFSSLDEQKKYLEEDLWGIPNHWLNEECIDTTAFALLIYSFLGNLKQISDDKIEKEKLSEFFTRHLDRSLGGAKQSDLTYVSMYATRLLVSSHERNMSEFKLPLLNEEQKRSIIEFIKRCKIESNDGWIAWSPLPELSEPTVVSTTSAVRTLIKLEEPLNKNEIKKVEKFLKMQKTKKEINNKIMWCGFTNSKGTPRICVLSQALSCLNELEKLKNSKRSLVAILKDDFGIEPDNIYNFVLSCWKEGKNNGGFACCPSLDCSIPTIPCTKFALKIISQLTLENYNENDKEEQSIKRGELTRVLKIPNEKKFASKIMNFVMSCYDKQSGGFKFGEEFDQADIYSTLQYLRILTLLENELDQETKKKNEEIKKSIPKFVELCKGSVGYYGYPNHT